MRTILIILAIFLLCNSSYSQNGWVQAYDNPSVSLGKQFFIDQYTGWVLGDSGRLTTKRDLFL
ncbi:MAG: hypothetical protein J0M18_20585 [Ignavibacteria bacterium]|nr:hypothetical protein [Ignavibacteria bacterium]